MAHIRLGYDVGDVQKVVNSVAPLSFSGSLSESFMFVTCIGDAVNRCF
jgi:hypothetical protein